MNISLSLRLPSGVSIPITGTRKRAEAISVLVVMPITEDYKQIAFLKNADTGETRFIVFGNSVTETYIHSTAAGLWKEARIAY